MYQHFRKDLPDDPIQFRFALPPTEAETTLDLRAGRAVVVPLPDQLIDVNILEVLEVVAVCERRGLWTRIVRNA